MIYDLSQLVKAELARRKFPQKVFYGPERTTRDGQAPAIVFERDRETPEPITAAPGHCSQSLKSFAVRNSSSRMVRV